MQQAWIVVAYEAIAFIFICGLVERVGNTKMTDSEFNWRYFLKWSVGLATAMQLVGFITLTSILYHNQESLAVTLAALVGIPGFLILTMLIQARFWDRYKRIPNLIRRLEKMPAAQREKVLSELPAKIFAQLPGDYRFVSHQSGSSR